MRCPNCGSYNFYVKDSRPEDNYVMRKRYCEDCGSKFTTYEYIKNSEVRGNAPSNCMQGLSGQGDRMPC